MKSPGIKLLGLGPGKVELLTRQAWDLLENSPEIYLRTIHHPIVPALPPQLRIHSFDDLYESCETFEEVYNKIIAQVLELGNQPQGVIYAVPGHPFIAEATSPEIARQAEAQGLSVNVVPGMSFLEPTLTALRIDPLPQTVLVDALELVVNHVPNFSPGVPALLAQVYSNEVASEVKLTLMAVYPDEHPVKLVHSAGLDNELIEDLPLYMIDQSPYIGLLTSLYIPPLDPFTSFEAFHETIAHLRAPDGCPWDREQTHKSLRPYLLEETYEVLTALDSDDPESMKEEFGDLLLQIFLHAQIASENGEYNIVDVLKGINLKIVNRHPHVFGKLDLIDSKSVLLNWEKMKAEERISNGKDKDGILDGVAITLPALVQAEQYQKRASRVGFNFDEGQILFEKLENDLTMIFSDLKRGDPSEKIGEFLFRIVNFARQKKVDSESALREANARFHKRIQYIERSAQAQGLSIDKLSKKEKKKIWKTSLDQ
ncbi:nucleoside triphosphate pyrophosphohydrolase [Chloroflexota bacterium]